MSNVSFWSAACSTAFNRPQSSLFASFHAISGILVRQQRSDASTTNNPTPTLIDFDLIFMLCIVMNRPRHVFTIAAQIFFSCASAFASGFMLFRWRRLDLQAKEGLWNMYRFFTGFMCLSSCISVACWSVYIGVFSGHIFFFTNLEGSLRQVIDPKQKASYPFDQVLLAMAYSQSRWAAWQILHSIDFTFFIASNMMVLDRMRTFSLSPQKYVKAARLGAAGVIAVCLVGVCGSVVSALSRLQSASLAGQTASAYLNLTKYFPRRDISRVTAARLTEGLWFDSRKTDEYAVNLDSIQYLSEMSVLMLQVVLFLVMGIMCVRRVKSYLLSSCSASMGNSARRLHQQIVVTAAVFFITFLPRATFATMKAVSNVHQDYANGQCYGFCSDVVIGGRAPNCLIPFNTYFHMAVYLQYTPEFQLLVVLMSSPLVQLVALWGMTSDRMLQAMGIRDARMPEAGRRLLDTKSETSSPVVVNGVPKARA